MSNVYDCNDQSQRLGTRIGQGGEGAVYRLELRPELAVKVFHDHVLAQHGSALQRKIDAQVALYDSVKHLALAWPRMSVFDDRRRWIGYAMRYVSGRPLRNLAHPALQREQFPSIGRRGIAQRLIRLLESVRELHALGIVLGDINLNNVLISADSPDAVTLIDCDSMQTPGSNGETHHCRVGVAEFIPPEHHGKDFSTFPRTLHSDLYSLAILMFQAFMLGRHPFDQIGGESPLQNMRSGHFPYGKTGIAPGRDGGVPVGPWYLLWSWLSFNLKDAWCITFREGSNNPQRRISITRWIELLEQYDFSIKNGLGGLVDDLRPAGPKPANSSRN